MDDGLQDGVDAGASLWFRVGVALGRDDGLVDGATDGSAL